jgi:archaellum component FlaC
MAAPMMPSFTQQTMQTMESDPERSPVPEGWGEAISPTEDAAILQRQMLSSKPRKSSHDIDPAYPSPTKSEFGLLPARPLSTVAQTDEDQAVETETPELAATSPIREATPDKPHSLKTTKSSRSLEDVSADQTMPAKETVSIPGALPLPTSTPLETPSYYRALPDPEPVPAEHADRVRQPSDTNEVTQSDSDTRPGASDYTISARDSQSTKTSFPVHSRKESLRSEEGRSSGSASYRNAHLLTRITAFGGLRSSSYGGRPNSYARSDAQFSETGYVPEEITADPNAAKLFGSLGELFMAERRRAVEYQNQLRQLEARTSGHEEHIGNLQRELEEKEGHASRAAEELRAVQSRSQQHENNIREATQQRDALQHQHRELRSSYEGLQTRHKDLENTHQQLRTTANSLQEKLEHEVQERERLLAEAKEAQNQERRALVAEITALREQVETHGRERDLARKQLAQIKALLDPSP